jgi:outer membrane protein
MRNFLILTALSSLLLAKVVTFNEVLKETLNNNLELKAKKLNIDKAKADLYKAKGMEWGKFIFSEEISRTNNAMYVFGMKLGSREATFRDFGFSDFLGPMGQALMIADDATPNNLNPAAMAGVLDIKPHDLNNPAPRSNFSTK